MAVITLMEKCKMKKKSGGKKVSTSKKTTNNKTNLKGKVAAYGPYK